ncbi:hypothetical protein PISMIDRAFT_12847 [Pisolithus microcarpus 441]|uniref:Uncharacterized protein n=1 Tax=Pisolithus microcarpus 441 TaxID=765257 RepID=A0A0C9ZDW1_9AGAM|nr:hypothetical protein PISMIDRAFT_12847 [Pisolithus microcarpus 441]
MLTGDPVSGTQLYKDQQEYKRKCREQAEEEDRTAGEQEGVGNEGVEEEKVKGEMIEGQSAWQNMSEEPPDELQQQRT